MGGRREEEHLTRALPTQLAAYTSRHRDGKRVVGWGRPHELKIVQIGGVCGCQLLVRSLVYVYDMSESSEISETSKISEMRDPGSVPE